MPTVFRSMKAAEDGLPVVGDKSKELGVRVPPNPSADIDVDDATGLVVLNGKGMSVAADWRDLPYHLIPKRLKAIVADARGSDNIRCYRIGTGPFAMGDVTAELVMMLKSGKTRAGNICPSGSVSVVEFQSLLAATRVDWVEDES
jgi:hypothetical protein